MDTTRTFADRVCAWEGEFLAPEAARSYPACRAVDEPDSPVRTPFQRDRDRIVHSKAFRRLKHKTQVFVAPEGDHYRTRLTPPHPPAGGLWDRPHGPPCARPQRGPDRGDRARPRPRPSALWARGGG